MIVNEKMETEWQKAKPLLKLEGWLALFLWQIPTLVYYLLTPCLVYLCFTNWYFKTMLRCPSKIRFRTKGTSVLDTLNM